MKCLKAEEYVKRTASLKETKLLTEELQNYVKSQRAKGRTLCDQVLGRTVCDRVIRACNHHLGTGSTDLDHVGALVQLVEVSLHGYDVSVALAAQSTPLYMEKIIFHIVKKLSSLEAHSLCDRVSGLLYSRLSAAQQGEDFFVLVRSCLSLLWNGLNATKKILKPHDKLHYRMRALSFLLMLDTESAAASISKAPMYTEDALTEFESSCGVMTKKDASFLLQEMHTLFGRCWTGEGGNKRSGPETSVMHVLSEIVLIIVKVLSKASHYDLASGFVNEVESRASGCADSWCTAFVLARWAVKIHSAMKAGKESGQALTECARALRSLSADLGDREAHAVYEGCCLVMWAVESGQGKGMSGLTLLACFSFIEEQQERILNILKKSSTSTAESNKLQQTLCFNIYQGFVFTYESMLASQLENSEILDRVLLYCQASAGFMMTELHKLSSEYLLIKAVIAVSNLACGLYNKHLYDQAYTLVEILCRDLCKNGPNSLSVDRLSRPFMLAVQASRWTAHLERALDWVILWLKALGDNITTHMSEPVSLWVKTKTDPAHKSEDEIHLRTLRDGFGPDVPDEGVMLCLLEEELRAYKEVAGDTSQGRYNTLCDLLDICHEESSYTHLRAVYLCEMAQVVCYQDFSEQTDCTAVDFIQESLRLLKEVQETPDNADKLKDDRAHASLWLYICMLEKNLQEATEKDKKQQEMREQTQCAANPIETNDFDYEDKQKTQDSVQVYEGLHFNLAAENKMYQPLEQALDQWSTLLQGNVLPSVRNPKRTCSSILVMAALFKLMGKPLKALEAYKLQVRISSQLTDAHGCADSLCQSASILLDMGSPELALVQLKQAEQFLTSDSTTDKSSSLPMMVHLLRAQYYYSTGQVDLGVPYLCEVLKEVNEQRQSKSWYMLRARTLRTCSSYLSLDTAALPEAQRNPITLHRINSPDTALIESLKLLHSLLITIVPKGIYGIPGSGSSSTMRFIDQGAGDNLVMKWQVVSEVLSCSVQIVSLRSSCGAIIDARHQCLQALKLTIKLQALAQCAELLVMKAELELMRGEREESGFDLDKVRNLLELCTDFSDQVQKTEVKFKPRKVRTTQKPRSPLPVSEDDFKEFLRTRLISKEPVVADPASSPPLKPRARRWLSSLEHEPACQCRCCSEPCLGHATAHWAATQADLVLKLDPSEAKGSWRLQMAALTRCKSASAKVGRKLAKLFPPGVHTKGCSKPSLMQDVMGHVYLRMALSGLETGVKNVSSIWKVLDAGLTYVESNPSPVLRSVRAGLMATKAIVSLVTLAAKKGCTPEELFSDVWSWNTEKADIKLRLERKTEAASSLKKTKEDAKKVKLVKPKIQVTGSTKGKGLVPMTPVMVKSKPTVGDLGCFDYNTVVPTLAFTPVQKVRAPASAQKVPKTASKLQFRVFEELSPVRDKAQHVPAAPRRTKKSRFKVEFSDESDTEANIQEEVKENTDPPKKRTTTRRAAKTSNSVPETPAEKQKAPPKRQAKSKKSTALAQSTPSDDDLTLAQETAPTRRGRRRRVLSKAEADSDEELEKMRTIEEENTEVFNMSIEELRASDTEGEDNPASKQDLEVLRRDMCCGFDRDNLSEPRSRGHLRDAPQTHLSPSDTRPDNLSLEDIESLLRSSWLKLQHFPSPTIYSTLCSLLALTTGQHDPVTTAMLQAQSLGITSRHYTIMHFASCLKKLRKAPNELAHKMDALSLDEPSPSDSKNITEKMLLQMQDIFSFPTNDPQSFPKSHCQELTKQIKHLPSGVMVCLMSVIGVKPGVIGDSLLLTRLEKGSAPVSVHILTSKQQRPISWLLQEMDNILAGMKVVTCGTEKAKWWEGRRALDSRIEKLLKEMECLLGCWRSFLLPLSLDSDVPKQAKLLYQALSRKGVKVSEQMLKAVLSASPILPQDDLRRFALGLSSQWDEECDQLLQTALSKLVDREKPAGHVVLILDKYLQKLPWESMSFLSSSSVSRMPSLHSLIGLSIQKETVSQSILKQGVDSRQVFYVLDPDANLANTQGRFKDWFRSKPDWKGVCGVAPDSGQLEEAVATMDLYIYVGHGAGSRFLTSQGILKQQMRAASLILGCSSAALAVRGEQEGQGILLTYLMAGCPFYLGNLWDVTDIDIDRFTQALLESWLSAGSGSSLLDYMGPSRRATNLKYLIGAAPVVYGLPIHLQ